MKGKKIQILVLVVFATIAIIDGINTFRSIRANLKRSDELERRAETRAKGDLYQPAGSGE